MNFVVTLSNNGNHDRVIVTAKNEDDARKHVIVRMHPDAIIAVREASALDIDRINYLR